MLSFPSMVQIVPTNREGEGRCKNTRWNYKNMKKRKHKLKNNLKMKVKLVKTFLFCFAKLNLLVLMLSSFYLASRKVVCFTFSVTRLQNVSEYLIPSWFLRSYQLIVNIRLRSSLSHCIYSNILGVVHLTYLISHCHL